MNSVMDIPTISVNTPRYSGIERRRPARAVVLRKQMSAPMSAARYSGRRVALEFASLLAAGLLCARLCTMLDKPAQAASTPPPSQFWVAVYQWAGFHRVAVR